MSFRYVRPSYAGDNCDRACGGFFVFTGQVTRDGATYNVFKCGACNREEEHRAA